MAKTINNFLVGVGFDLDKKSTGGVESGIDGIKSKALKLGTVVAGAFGIKALTADFASAKDDLGKFGEVFGVTANDVHAFGAAMRLEGGTLEGFMSQLAAIEQFRAGLAVGDAGFIAAAGAAGLDTQALIQAENATEGFLTLANQFQNLTQQQRLNAAQAMGLDESSIRLLSKGRTAIEDVVEEQKKIRPVTEEATKIAAEFNDQMQILGDNTGGYADVISMRLLPEINNVIAGMNDWIGLNRELLNSGLDSWLDNIGEQAFAIAAGLGLVGTGVAATTAGGLLTAAGAATGVGAIGTGGAALAAVGGAATTVGAGVVIPAAVGIAIGSEISDNLSIDAQDAIGRGITGILGFLGSQEDAARFRGDSERRAAVANATRQVPIQLTSNLILDGKVIDQRIANTVGEMADQAIQDTRSSEAG